MEEQSSNYDNKCHVVVLMVPLPIQGHINQLLHLSHIITSYNIPVHFAGYSNLNHQARLRLHGWGSRSLTNIHFHDFQLSQNEPSTSHLEHYFHPLFKAYLLLRDPTFQLLQKLSDKFRRVIVIHDFLMASVVQDVKLISNVEAYVFNATCAFSVFVNSWEGLPDKEKPFELESSVFPEDLPTHEGCGTPEIWEYISYQMGCLGFESGWIYNTSRVIDGKYVDLMEKLSSVKRKINHFAIGPFHPMDITREKGVKNRHECLEWLDKQEKDSVIYVSFGSITSLKYEQIEELAKGLERSGEKFIWVLRKPDPSLLPEVCEVPELPKWYEERVKDRGIVIRDWAPQLEILAHSSTGVFMSHCGWNSCIESISMGVPIAAWPMHSDQPRNAVLVTQVLRVGVMVRDWEHRDEIVRSSVIESVVKKLVALKEMQERAKELGEAVRSSVEQDGVSHIERDIFISHISR